MIGILMRLGLGKRAAQLVAFVAIPLLILGLFYLALDAYGDARADAREAEVDKAWADAAVKLQQESAASAGVATGLADKRAEKYAERLAAEKEKIDDAIATGADPIDVLFPPGGV